MQLNCSGNDDAFTSSHTYDPAAHIQERALSPEWARQEDTDRRDFGGSGVDDDDTASQTSYVDSIYCDTATPSKVAYVSEPHDTSGYTKREYSDLKAFVQRHKLSKIESSLFENEITVEFLLSQSLEAAAEIAAELTNSTIQQKKFVRAVEVAQQDGPPANPN